MTVCGGLGDKATKCGEKNVHGHTNARTLTATAWDIADEGFS